MSLIKSVAFFCEVKANSDVLKAVPVRRHEVLLNSGIDVSVFGVNKTSRWALEENAKYFNEEFYDEDDFKEVYDFKMKTAERTYARFRDENVDEIKTTFLRDYDLYSFLGFLNVVSDLNYLKIDNRIIKKSVKEGQKIRDLKYLSKGMFFEERGLYPQAIDEYKKVAGFERYERLNECYRRNKDGKNQVDLIYHVLNDVKKVPNVMQRDFKNRANRLFRNKNAIAMYETNEICPKCGSKVVLTKLQKRNNIAIFTCSRSSCYWYGGTYEGSLRNFTRINKHKRPKNVEIDSSLLDIDVDNLSYDEKVKVKRKLVRQGNGYIDRYENREAISFYIRLLSHGLFVNDYHPYRKLARMYHKEREFENELEIITRFLKSGIYCSENQFNWFKKRLMQLAKYGNVEYSRIDEVEEEFLANGAKNIALSNEPVPQAIKLKRQRTKF